MFNYKTHIFKMPDPRVRMPEPKALRVTLYQDSRPRQQLRRCRGWWRKLPQFCRLCRQGSHQPRIRAQGCLFKSAFRDLDSVASLRYLARVFTPVSISGFTAEQVASSDQTARLITNDSTPAAKIKLFRSLFRGRDDVYPRRFESRKTGKSGYAPACGNEWVRGVCEKPRIKCAECPNRRFLPVTDDVIRWQLSGCDDAGDRFVAGVYAMLLDETCFFLAVDFDKSGWLEDSTAYIETCRGLN